MALAFNKKFGDRSQKEQLEYLHKLCDSQNTALDIMQKERNEWRDKAIHSEKCLQAAEDAFQSQKATLRHIVSSNGAQMQSLNQDISKMVIYIGELGGDINRLGN